MPERYLGRNLGKYRVDAVVGTGGFAWVYKAYDPELEIPVALKILKPQYAGDEKFEQRFRREASTAARLRHPNIVKIYAVGREDDAVFFAMDYLPQGLHDRLDVMTTLPEPMLIRMGIDVASALGYAHREGVIHRDIKVDNILFDDHGNAIVADFGIARAAFNYAEVTGTNMVVGTPQYFSPEQARGLALDGRADIYSLGITMYKAATGRLPFLGEDWYEIARQHVEDKPPKPRSINPAISKELEEIILGCLEKDPNDRWDSGERLCQELAMVLQGRGESVQMRTLATPPLNTETGLAVSGPRRARQRRATRLIWSGAALMAIVVAGSVFYAGQRGEAHGREAAIDSANAAAAARRANGGPGGTGGLAGGPTDSAAARPLPPPTRPALIVRSSPGAAVSVNGVALARSEPGQTQWRLDTLPPGRYEVRAAVASLPDCGTSERSASATLGDTGEKRVNVAVAPCGTLMISGSTRNKKFENARFTYVARPVGADGRALQGTLPLKQPLVLPVGRWAITVMAPECFAFNDSVTVSNTRATRPVVGVLLCGST